MLLERPKCTWDICVTGFLWAKRERHSSMSWVRLASQECSDIVTILGDYILDALLEVNFCGSSVIWYGPPTVLTRCLETCLWPPTWTYGNVNFLRLNWIVHWDVELLCNTDTKFEMCMVFLYYELSTTKSTEVYTEKST